MEKKKGKKRTIILILLILLFLLIALYSAYQLFSALHEYFVGDQFYDDLKQYIQMEGNRPPETQPTLKEPTDPEKPTEPTDPADQNTQPTESTAPSEPEETLVWPVVDFESLGRINPDVVAWIYIPGTNVNYPVVLGADNDYYLYRMIDNSYNSAGSIFMDYRNHYDFSNANTVLYGHNMKNQSMFADVTRYSDQAYYDEHPYGMILTPNGNYLLEFFSGYVTDVYSEAWNMRFSLDTDYFAWLNAVGRQSYFNPEVRPTVNDRVVTLSTCTYDYDDARFVLHGILRPAE